MSSKKIQPASENTANRLRDPHSSGFVAPKYDGENISNLPDTFATLLKLKGKRPLTNSRFYDFARDSTIENVVFLLLDGFGMNSMKYASENFGFPSFEKLEKKGSLVLPLTSVFPSTTSTATTSLHTGLTPQEHGVIGYTTYLSEIGAVTQLLDMDPIFGRRSIFELGIPAEKFIGGQTIHERFKEEGVQSNLYINKYIVGSGLSQITNRGANVIPILSSPDMFVRLRKNLEKNAAGSPGFHFAYYASPDTIAHSRGPFSAEYAAEIESIFRALNQQLYDTLDRSIGRKTILLISADHGLAQIEKEDIIDLAGHKDLLALLKVPPTGDSRCLILHAKSEKAIADVENYFETRFSNLFQVKRSKEVLQEGLLGIGEIKEQVYDRLGDIIVVPRTSKAMDNSILQPRYDYVPGRHGGLSANEMIVPLIASRLG